jgi:hypothetical protein
MTLTTQPSRQASLMNFVRALPGALGTGTSAASITRGTSTLSTAARLSYRAGLRPIVQHLANIGELRLHCTDPKAKSGRYCSRTHKQGSQIAQYMEAGAAT